MTANASKNAESRLELMSPLTEKVTEIVLQLMQYFGLQKIGVRKLKTADFERIIATPLNFEGTPTKVAEFSYLVKDILAQLLASVGIVNLEIDASEEEKEKLIDGYLQLEDIYSKNHFLIASAESSINKKTEDTVEISSNEIAAENVNLQTE